MEGSKDMPPSAAEVAAAERKYCAAMREYNELEEIFRNAQASDADMDTLVMFNNSRDEARSLARAAGIAFEEAKRDCHAAEAADRAASATSYRIAEQNTDLLDDPAKQASVKPPSLAEKTLYLLLHKRHREHIPGDLEEEFQTFILPKFGLRYAKRWYWFQVIRTIVANHPWVSRFIAAGGGGFGLYQIAKGVFQGFWGNEFDEAGQDPNEEHR